MKKRKYKQLLASVIACSMAMSLTLAKSRNRKYL